MSQGSSAARSVPARQVSPAVQALVQEFRAHPPAGRDWLDQLRAAALTTFESLGFPGMRTEAWRYTNLAPLERTVWKPASAPAAVSASAAATRLADHATHPLVLVNGVLSPALSALDKLPRGVSVQALAEAQSDGTPVLRSYFSQVMRFESHALVALNTAMFSGGALLHIADDAVIDTPLNLVWLATGESTINHPRLLLALGRNSRAVVVEEYRSLNDDKTFTNAVSEIHVGEGARLEHIVVEEEAAGATHLAVAAARVERDARYGSHLVQLGGTLARHETHVMLSGRGASCQLNGLYLGRGRQHLDQFSLIDHAVPHTTSDELYKGILDERAGGVFSGKVVVREGAHHSDATQHNRNLLLSAGAVAHTRPQLEIYNDDVKCVHGATVGQLDADAMFYLKSRGIDPAEARQLLVRSFAGELVGRFPALWREAAERLLDSWVQGIRGAAV